ncbi:hypothetical protein BDP27DRAFT_1421526 [Rhodocollybia butyracea]|uniref:Uncharacterized protein n=1 Tax=Rhodocollybia butyracea TaxID=206335 RepID=A0A9P5U8F6_9AGAR|nr:hypothetical protein BDP27DRAFT_1421526 [Rhodocollybia butyracea]
MSYFPSTRITSLFWWRYKATSQSSSSSPFSTLIFKARNLAARCRLPIKRRSQSKSYSGFQMPTSYMTTPTAAQGTVTYASFGIDGEACGGNSSLENIDPNTGSVDIDTPQDPDCMVPLPSQTHERAISELKQPQKEHSLNSTATPLKKLSKKILARPPSLNNPPGSSISTNPSVELVPIAGDAEGENSSSDDYDVSDSDKSTGAGTAAESDSTSEVEEPVLRPLTVPPWHYKARRDNRAATPEPRPPYIVSDGETMRFPF